MRLIINVDDFGISKGVNLAVVDGYNQGVIKSTTALVGAPQIKHAVAQAKLCPDLGVGIHLSLDLFSSFSKLDCLSDENNVLYRSSIKPLDRAINYDDLYLEWDLQIKEFIKLFGKTPTHIDSHHHAHMASDTTISVVNDLASAYGITVRGLKDNLFSADFYDTDATLATLKRLINENKDREYINFEIMAHPAYLDNELLKLTSYSTKRMDELAILTSQEFKDLVIKENIIIDSY